MIRSIIATASTGNLPDADSADNITASVTVRTSSRQAMAVGLSSLATMPARPLDDGLGLDDVGGALQAARRSAGRGRTRC
jgi:hypothetical protein